jgi:hypothetical protein
MINKQGEAGLKQFDVLMKDKGTREDQYDKYMKMRQAAAAAEFRTYDPSKDGELKLLGQALGIDDARKRVDDFVTKAKAGEPGSFYQPTKMGTSGKGASAPLGASPQTSQDESAEPVRGKNEGTAAFGRRLTAWRAAQQPDAQTE